MTISIESIISERTKIVLGTKYACTCTDVHISSGVLYLPRLEIPCYLSDNTECTKLTMLEEWYSIISLCFRQNHTYFIGIMRRLQTGYARNVTMYIVDYPIMYVHRCTLYMYVLRHELLRHLTCTSLHLLQLPCVSPTFGSLMISRIIGLMIFLTLQRQLKVDNGSDTQ